MIKEKTVITLDPEEIVRFNAILLDEDREGAFDFLAGVIKKKVEEASKTHCKPVFELERGKGPDFLVER